MLDLALSILNLTSWVTSCKVVNKHLGSDHKLIEVIIQTSIACTSLQPRRNFKKADVNAVKAGTKWL